MLPAVGGSRCGVLVRGTKSMDYFRYQDGKLYIEGVAAERIAREVGTPAYIYSKATFEHHLRRMQQAYRELDTTVCFSVKACSNVSILRLMAPVVSL